MQTNNRWLACFPLDDRITSPSVSLYILGFIKPRNEKKKTACLWELTDDTCTWMLLIWSCISCQTDRWVSELWTSCFLAAYLCWIISLYREFWTPFLVYTQLCRWFWDIVYTQPWRYFWNIVYIVWLFCAVFVQYLLNLYSFITSSIYISFITCRSPTVLFFITYWILAFYFNQSIWYRLYDAGWLQ